tara:strand:- start:274 stop:1119 length:846 start_codon:yes stop_codon:yes gene_type:complete
MISKILFYCTSHKKINYLDNFANLNLIACGEKKFDDKWEFINMEDNINKKFLSYGDLTAHYTIWKTFIKKKVDQKIWVGLCQYRRHWVNDNFDPKKKYSLKDLKEVILIDSKSSWKNYDAILTSPFVFKPKLLEKIKRLNFLINKVTIKQQMLESLGKDSEKIYEKILTKLPADIADKFDQHISKSNILSAHGMYISTPKILDEYMALSFDWYKNCENILDTNENIYLVKKPRFFQYLNERFSDFWFKNYTSFTTNSICMYQEKENKLSLIGKHLNEKKVN